VTGRLTSLLLVVGVASWVTGCDPSNDREPATAITPGPLMRPGWNCLASGCHFPDKQPRPPDWGAGGTVFATVDAPPDQGVEGVIVLLQDAEGKEVRLITNAAGNFFTPEPLKGPIDVTLERDRRRIKMPKPAPAGSCNFCHSQPPIPEGPAGRIYAPLMTGGFPLRRLISDWVGRSRRPQVPRTAPRTSRPPVSANPVPRPSRARTA
jgi:hypothetical protein